MIDQPPPDESEEMPEPPSKGTTTISVVGIGGSAGGLEVFKHLLTDLPADTGFAIVLIQHLDPTHKSSLSDILGRATTMPVRDATEDVPVERNHVYVIPPNTELTIANRVLKLPPRSSAGGRMPIDHFLRSLAQDCRSSAIGVILSGAGSDGGSACRQSKSMAASRSHKTRRPPNSPACHKWRRRPLVSISSCRPRENRRRTGEDREAPTLRARATCGTKRESDEADSAEILTVMRETTGIDFSLYREKTVQRRVMRRLALRNIASTEEYAKRLKQDPGRAQFLQRDLLISVTSFFRDPDHSMRSASVGLSCDRSEPAHGHGDSHLGAGMRHRGGGLFDCHIVTGVPEGSRCSFPVQIFASDISEAAIEKARSGQYLENIAADVSPERLIGTLPSSKAATRSAKLCVSSVYSAGTI